MSFRLRDLAFQVRLRLGTLAASYGTRQAACDLRNLRAKSFVVRLPRSRRYDVPADGVRAITALVVLREQVIKPLLASASPPSAARDLTPWTPLDDHYQTLREDMHALFADLGVAS